MKIKTFHYYFLVTVILCLFQNCTVQKRIYQKGYYVSNKKAQSTLKHKPENGMNTSNTDLFASNNNDLASILSKKNNPSDTCGDLLFLNDSTRLAVKVTEINEQYIKYKRCDNFTGPQYTVTKNKIAMVLYSNGVKEVFTKVVTGCKDSLILINGNTMLASVIEVNNEVVKYKSCNDLKGPARELNMSNVGRIRYSDGRVAKYNEVVKPPEEKESHINKMLRNILGGILIALGVSIIIGLSTIGPSAALLGILYILFLLFLIGFMFAMGWQQNFPFMGFW